MLPARRREGSRWRWAVSPRLGMAVPARTVTRLTGLLWRFSLRARPSQVDSARSEVLRPPEAAASEGQREMRAVVEPEASSDGADLVAGLAHHGDRRLAPHPHQHLPRQPAPS